MRGGPPHAYDGGIVKGITGVIGAMSRFVVHEYIDVRCSNSLELLTFGRRPKVEMLNSSN